MGSSPRCAKLGRQNRSTKTAVGYLWKWRCVLQHLQCLQLHSTRQNVMGRDEQDSGRILRKGIKWMSLMDSCH